jgi:hypothetical protein
MKHRKPFVGVDGEGGNIGVSGRHEYLLLRAGEHVLETGMPLTSIECLHFLATLPRNATYVSFFFNYDVTMILKGLPESVVANLLDIDSRTWIDERGRSHVRRVWYEDYGFDYLPGKEFRVCWNPDRTNSTPIQWTVINDVSGFFQSSFVSALIKWNISTEAMHNRISAQKQRRSSFECITNLTRLYNKKECELLAELMTSFREVISSVSLLPTKWQGPGRLASVWLAHYNTTTIKSLQGNRTFYEVLEAANHAYYGGRFETTIAGPVRRTVHEYDINSAYPSAMSRLPCLAHGRWTKRRNPHSICDGLYLAHVHFESNEYILGQLPIRNDSGNISFPRSGSGWYWSHEIEAAIECGTKITVDTLYTYSKVCDCIAFEWVEELYYVRERLGKSEKGHALKLVLNSLYGKMTQSVGRPKYANPIWASLITSMTRAQLINAYRGYESHVLMLATDGIITDIPLPHLPISDKLGEWTHKQYDSMFIVQPGLYTLSDEEPKTRGVPQHMLLMHERGLRKHYQAGNVKRPYPIKLNRFYGMRQAIAQGHWESAGIWYNESRDLTFDWRAKRSDEGRADSVIADDEVMIHDLSGTDALPGWRTYMQSGGTESVYYGKEIGRWSAQRQWDEDQPEVM